jgi:two-component system phosphate regulon sensor histidine kinase PhoR
MTMGSPIFRKLLLSAFLLIAATLLVMDFYLVRHTERREAEKVQQQLVAEARILRGELDSVAPAELDEWADRAGERAQARVTLIDPAGNVLADSQFDPLGMENHDDRPEVREAAAGRTGTSIRRSATGDLELCYAAIPLTYGGQPGWVLRLAVPLSDIRLVVGELRRGILAASLAAAAVALAIAYIFSRSFTRRVRRLQAFAERLPEARQPEKLPPDADDELGALAAALSRTAVQLRDLIEKLELESRRRQSILAGMTEGVLAVDADMRVIFGNDAFARAVRARWPLPEQVPVRELARDPELIDLLDAVVARGERLKRRLHLVSAGGRSYEVQAAPLAVGARRGALALFHDITDLERLERIRKDFVANVSHELRTPLTAIRGYAETLLDGALEDPQNNRKFVEVILAHAIRLNNISADLLVLSELESNRPAPEPEPVPVRAAVEAALRTVESEARLRDVRVLGGAVDDTFILGHRTGLEQALVNLLDNAVKFNRPGGEVTLEARRNDGQVVIRVSDTGIGIPSEDLPRIFERFYRVDKGRSREVGGTGLGLSIVKHAVERMHGEVRVDSQVGKGSTFTVLLPAARPVEDRPAG